MAQENLNTSNPNDGLGDFLRSAFIKVQNMFTELYGNVVFKVTGKDLSTNDFTDVLKDKLDNIEAFADVNVQSDWAQDDDTQDDYIKNKPTIPVLEDYVLNGGYGGTAQDLYELITSSSSALTFTITGPELYDSINLLGASDDNGNEMPEIGAFPSALRVYVTTPDGKADYSQASSYDIDTQVVFAGLNGTETEITIKITF